MTTIITRSGKGAALTHTEVDANFTNLNADKAEVSAVILATQKGAASGVAPLDATSKISSTYLPSYVDDVLEYANYAALPATGETGKIYVALDTNKTYRWSGSAYVYITSGAVDSVAGKTGVVTLVKADVGLSNVDNTTDASKPVSTATQIALDLKAPISSPTFTGTTTAANLAYTGTLTGSTGILNIGSGQLYKDASGNVGIGTSSPLTKLNVVGAILSSLTAAPNYILDSLGSYYGFIQNDSANTWSLSSGTSRSTLGTPALTWNSSGNVLVGTTISSGKLTVAGTISCSSGFASDVTLTDTTTTTYTAGTYYTLPGTVNVTVGNTYLVYILFTHDNIAYHNWCGGGIIGLTTWQAGGTNTTWTIPMDTHVDGAQTITIKANTSSGSRTLAWTPSVTTTVTTGGSIVVRLKLISTF